MIETKNLTPRERQQLLNDLQKQQKADREAVRHAYEGLKAEFLEEIYSRVLVQRQSVKNFFDYLVNYSEGFREIMDEYGAIKTNQLTFTLVYGNFKFEAKTNKVKKFDERADMAAVRLVSFLKEWVKGQPDGTDNAMYQLAMLAIERNANGDLDYKQISNLQKVETKFNHPEYSEIMTMFRESHIIEGTSTNFYFYERTELGVWKKIEISFNRM